MVLNLASQEYWAAVDGRLPAGVRVVSVDFRQVKGGEERFESFAAKRARGTMARWMAEHHVRQVEVMKGFDADGYRFAGEDGDTWRFVRG